MCDDRTPGSQSHPGSSTAETDTDDFDVFLWGDGGLRMRRLAEHAPAWSPLQTMEHRLYLRRGAAHHAAARMEYSQRWFVAQREARRPVDEDGDPLEDFRLQRGDVVCFIEDLDDHGCYVSPPALVVAVQDSDDPGGEEIITLLDDKLPLVCIDEVPFPLDVEAMRGEWGVVTGRVRRAFLNLWGLDVVCPRCSAISDSKVKSGDGYQAGQYKCRACHHRWPEDVEPGVMAEPEVHAQFAHWTLPVTDSLAPLVEAGWVFDPFDLAWDWDHGVSLTSRLSRGDEVIELGYDPQTDYAHVLGPIDFGPGGVLLDMGAGPADTRIALAEVPDLMEARP